MRLIRIVGAAFAVLAIAVAALGVYGFPARGLIESASRDALAKENLALDIDSARIVLFPRAGLTIDRARLRDAGGEELASVERVTADLALSDALSGHPRVTELKLLRPVVQADPLFRRSGRAGDRRDRGGGGRETLPPVILPGSTAAGAIDEIAAEDATLVLRDGRDVAEVKVDSLRIAATPGAGGRKSLALDARSGPTTLRLIAGVDGADRLVEGQPIPIEAVIKAPTVLKTPVSLTAAATKNGPSLRFDNLSAAIDQGQVRGAISISFAGAKPFVDAALESDRIDLTSLGDSIASVESAWRRQSSGGGAAPREPGASAPARAAPIRPQGAGDPSAAGNVWSDAPLNLFGLRTIEGNVSLNAREVLVDKVRIAPAAIEATLLQDVLTAKLSPSGLYGGHATGDLVIDRSRDDPDIAVRASFSNLDALPFLRDAIAFENVSGRARGALGLRAAGVSPRRIIGSLNGSGHLMFEDGAVRGLNMPDMVRSLLDMIIAGWQAKDTNETRFKTFSATFAIENGVARTNDLAFNGPYMTMTATGSADLRAQTLDLRAEPKLISSPSTPDKGNAPWSIGVPVVIQGPWAAPRIYANAPNILANPEGALKTLRDALGGAGGLGGLIGGGGAGGGGTGGGGAGGGGAVTDGPLGKVIEGVQKGLGKPSGDPARDTGGIADELLKAFGGGRTSPQPAPQDPSAAAPPSSSVPPPPAPPPPPDPRDFLRDLLGR